MISTLLIARSLTLILPLMAASVQAGSIYKCKQPDGSISFTDSACPKDTVTRENKDEYNDTQIPPMTFSRERARLEDQQRLLRGLNSAVEQASNYRYRERMIKRQKAARRSQRRVDTAYQRAGQSESRARNALERAEQAEKNAKWAEIRAQQAENQARQVEQQMRANETRARNRAVERNLWGNNLW